MVIVIAIVIFEVPRRADIRKTCYDFSDVALEDVRADAGEGGRAAAVVGTGDDVDRLVHVLVAALGLEEGFSLRAAVVQATEEVLRVGSLRRVAVGGEVSAGHRPYPQQRSEIQNPRRSSSDANLPMKFLLQYRFPVIGSTLVKE